MSYSNEDCQWTTQDPPHEPEFAFHFRALADEMRELADTLKRRGHDLHVVNADLYELHDHIGWVNWKVCQRISGEDKPGFVL